MVARIYGNNISRVKEGETAGTLSLPAYAECFGGSVTVPVRRSLGEGGSKGAKCSCKWTFPRVRGAVGPRGERAFGLVQE